MLYHFECGFPKTFIAPLGQFRIRYSEHARRAAARDRYGDLSPLLPNFINTANANLIEIEQNERQQTIKLLYRVPATPQLDLCIAVACDSMPWRVKTCWANEHNDVHHTLQRGRYGSNRELVGSI
jgi:hypothetical protein